MFLKLGNIYLQTKYILSIEHCEETWSWYLLGQAPKRYVITVTGMNQGYMGGSSFLFSGTTSATKTYEVLATDVQSYNTITEFLNQKSINTSIFSKFCT